MHFLTQKFLVFGLSVSGRSAVSFLLNKGAGVCVSDEDSSIYDAFLKEFPSVRGIPSARIAESVDGFDVLVLSPGVPIDHEIPILFKKHKKRIIGELQLGADGYGGCLITVTGTNGKTTVAELLTHILKTDERRAVACGNIGLPVTSAEALGSDYAVCEVSSFQLETARFLRPHIAVVTNITADHLDRHYQRENYVFLKKRTVRNQRESEYAVLNYDDETVRQFSEEIKSRAVFFSAKQSLAGGCVKDGRFYFFDEEICPVDAFLLQGEHNLSNALAAITAAKLLGVANESVRAALSTFHASRHRLERVATVGGVTYINDSKSTNADSTVCAVRSMTEPTVLLLGGRDKGCDYADLFSFLHTSNVIHVVLYGENAYKLFSCANRANFTAVTLCCNLTLAVRFASVVATVGQVVLLSPASASFDGFENYKKRGDEFCRLVGEIENEAALH